MPPKESAAAIENTRFLQIERSISLQGERIDRINQQFSDLREGLSRMEDKHTQQMQFLTDAIKKLGENITNLNLNLNLSSRNESPQLKPPTTPPDPPSSVTAITPGRLNPGATRATSLLGVSPVQDPMENVPDLQGVNQASTFGNKLPRVDFPKLFEVQVRSWIQRAQRILLIHPMDDRQKALYASLNFRDVVESWVQTDLIHFTELGWKEFSLSVQTQFSDSLAENVIGEFKLIYQRGTVLEYHLLYQLFSNNFINGSPKRSPCSALYYWCFDPGIIHILLYGSVGMFSECDSTHNWEGASLFWAVQNLLAIKVIIKQDILGFSIMSGNNNVQSVEEENGSKRIHSKNEIKALATRPWPQSMHCLSESFGCLNSSTARSFARTLLCVVSFGYSTGVEYASTGTKIQVQVNRILFAVKHGISIFDLLFVCWVLWLPMPQFSNILCQISTCSMVNMEITLRALVFSCCRNLFTPAGVYASETCLYPSYLFVVGQSNQMTKFKGRLHWIKTGTLYNILTIIQIQYRTMKKTWSFANREYSRPWMCTEDRYLICYAAESVFPSPKRTVQHLYIDEELCLGAIMGVCRIIVGLFKDFSWDPFRDYNASDGGGAKEYTVQDASPYRGLDITFLYRVVTVEFACHPRCPIFSWHLTPLLDFSCQGFALNTQLQCKHFWQVSALCFSSLMIVVYECDDDSRVYASSSPNDSVHWSILLHDQILKITGRLLVKDFGCYWPITRDHTYTWEPGNATLLMSINSMTSSENKETPTSVLQFCAGLYTGYSLRLVLQWQIAWCEVSMVHTVTSGWYGIHELLFAFDIHVSWYPSEITIEVTIASTKKASHSVHLICVRSLRFHSWSTTTTCVVLGLIVILFQGSMSMFSVYDSRVQIVWLIPGSATWFNIQLDNALALSLMVASLKASQVTFVSLTVWFTCELPVSLALCKGIVRNPTPNISWLPSATTYRLENIQVREQLVFLYNVQVPSILQLFISKNLCVSFMVHPVHWGFSSDRAGLFIWRQIGTVIGPVVRRMISELFAAPMCRGREKGETRVSTSFLIKPLPLNIILSSKEEDEGGTVLHSWWYNPHILIYTPSSPMKVDSHMWLKSPILANTVFVAMSNPVIQDYLETFDTFWQALLKGGWLIGIQSSSSAASNVVQVLSRVGAIAYDSKGGQDRLLADSGCLPFVRGTVSEVRLYTFDDDYKFRFAVLLLAADGTLGGNYTRDEMSATSCDQQEIHIFSSSTITSLKVINAHDILKCSAQSSPIQFATTFTNKMSSTSPHHTLQYQQPFHPRPSSPPTLLSILTTDTVAAAVSSPTNLVPPHNHTSSSTAHTCYQQVTILFRAAILPRITKSHLCSVSNGTLCSTNLCQVAYYQNNTMGHGVF